MSTAIILAGGKSSRMGQPKALLPFDGEPLIVHIVRTMQRMFDEILVVAAPGQDLPSMPVTQVHDSVAYQGPVGGICYGLQAADGDVCFVTSCDSAFLNTDLIAHLVSEISGYDVVVPHWQGRFQPMHAVYRKSVMPFLEAQLANGQLRPVSLFDKVRTRRVEEDEIRRFDPDGTSFFNMNTPEDYATALRRWHDLRRGNGVTPAAVGCTVELFGVARLVSGTSEVSLELPFPATLAHVFQALAEKLPMLVGRVIDPEAPRLADGYTCNVNGLEFVRRPTAAIDPGDRVMILSADAGG